MEFAELMRDVWKVDVMRDYEARIVASERELQACLYKSLRDRIPRGANLRIFVEPTVLPLKRRPDLIVAKPLEGGDYDTVAVIELKLDRGGSIKYEEELTRIQSMGSLAKVTIANQRFDQRGSNLTLRISEETRFFLCFVGQGDISDKRRGCLALYPDRIRKANHNRFFDNPSMAVRTELFFGRVFSEGRLEFDSCLLDGP